MLRSCEKTSLNFVPFRPRGRPDGMPISTATRIAASTAAIASTAGAKPIKASSAAPSRKPSALHRVLRPGQHRDPAEEPALAPVGASTLTALLALILERSFATPETPCTAMT